MGDIMKKIILLIIVVLIAVNVYAGGAKLSKEVAQKNLQEVIRLVDTYDIMAAVEYMNSRGKAFETAMQYNRLVKDPY